MPIILPLPPTTNHTYIHSGHTVFMTKEAKHWIKQALKILKQFPKPDNEPDVIEIVYFVKYDRDVDGSHKIILDTLEKAGWFKNDKIVTDLFLHKRKDKEHPRVLIHGFKVERSETQEPIEPENVANEGTEDYGHANS